MNRKIGNGFIVLPIDQDTGKFSDIVMVGVRIEFACLRFIKRYFGFAHARTKQAARAGDGFIHHNLIGNIVSTIQEDHGFFFVRRL